MDVSGTTSQTLYHNGTTWIGTSNLSNNGTAVTIDKDASINGMTVGKGSGTYVSGNGYHSIAFGNNALNANTSGNYNVGVGYEALTANTSGNNNVGVGYRSLYSNTTGEKNTANGSFLPLQ